MISAAVVTCNEAEKLAICLDSISSFCDEIVVVDLQSNDGVAKVAKQYGAILDIHHKVPYVEKVRNYSISKANGDWILILDPDERVPQTLITQLEQVILKGRYQAVNIPRKNIFFGKWIRHTNFWADKQIRFFKKGSVVWPGRIHAYPQVMGKILDLPATAELAIEHYGYDNFREFLSRQQRYSKIEAENRLKEGKRFSLWQLFWQPLREFLVRFIKHRGFMDGIEGIFLVVALMLYQVQAELRMLQLQRKR